MFQDPHGSFDPRHRAGRIVSEPLHLLGGEMTASGRERLVADALIEVGLSADDAHKYPHEFSGGQRQRLAIARALITRPELIVLDEPVSALDVSIRAQVLDLLADLQARLGLAYLFISHDLAVIRAITDRVLVMQKGRIVEEGATSKSWTHRSTPIPGTRCVSASPGQGACRAQSRLSVPNQRKLSTLPVRALIASIRLPVSPGPQKWVFQTISLNSATQRARLRACRICRQSGTDR